MNRMTKRYGQITVLIDHGFSAIDVAVNRLAAYEDIGLEPKEVKEFLEDVESRFYLWINKRYGIPTTKFMDIMQAEKDGRLVVLPCKPGETVWGESCIAGRTAHFEAPDITWIIENTERFGQEIFLTREEAEAAMKKRGHSDNGKN